jgi:hypothetical protein
LDVPVIATPNENAMSHKADFKVFTACAPSERPPERQHDMDFGSSQEDFRVKSAGRGRDVHASNRMGRR